jgi:hypothetical protein
MTLLRSVTERLPPTLVEPTSAFGRDRSASTALSASAAPMKVGDVPIGALERSPPISSGKRLAVLPRPRGRPSARHDQYAWSWAGVDSVVMGWRSLVLAALVLVGSDPARAQEDLDPLWRMPFDASEASNIEARSLQLYRVPVSFTLRDAEKRAWGLDLTLPVTLGGYSVRAVVVDGLLSDRLSAYSVVPGLEFQVPAGAHWMVKPFAELGVGGSSAGGSGGLLWGAGTRLRGTYATGRARWTLGGAAEYRAGGGDRSLVEHYSMLAAIADFQEPLSFTVAGRATRAGAFVAYRFLTDATFRTLNADDLEVRHQVETGLSLSASPAFKLWFIKVPWIGVAYRAAGALSGVRIYLAFPF